VEGEVGRLADDLVPVDGRSVVAYVGRVVTTRLARCR
jgi:hypothetical protein